MSIKSVIDSLKLSAPDAEVIFDRDEPVGQPTDLVLPGRRWFRRKSDLTARPSSPRQIAIQQNPQSSSS